MNILILKIKKQKWIENETKFSKGMDICRNFLWDVLKNNSISWKVLSKVYKFQLN